MTTLIPYRFMVRRRTAANWTSGNEVLLLAEIGLETDTNRMKYGDGVTAWNSLPYYNDNIWSFGAVATGLRISSNAAVVNDVRQETAGVARWIGRKNGDAESGSSAGSNYEFQARADDGSLIGIVYSVVRSTRKFDFKVTPSVNGVDLGASSGGIDWQTCGFYDEFLPGAWGHYAAIPNSASNTVFGINASLLTATGTGGFDSFAVTNEYTRQPRFKYTSAAGAGSLAGVVNNTNVACGDGGWFFSWRGGIGDAAAVANGVLVVGMRNATAAAPNTDPTSHLNVIYFANDPGDANMQIIHNDGSGTGTKVDLGANFPANSRLTDIYEVRFRYLKGSGNLDYHVLNCTNDQTASGTISTNLPATSTSLGPCYYRGNRTTALAVVIHICGWNIAYNFDGQ